MTHPTHEALVIKAGAEAKRAALYASPLNPGGE